MHSDSISSSLEETRNYITSRLAELEKVIEDESLLFDIRIVLNELIINGVIHGNKCKKEKDVKVTIVVDKEAVSIEVEDEGLGIDYNFDIYDPNRLESYGRGLVIVKGLVDELTIEGNKVKATKYIN